MNHRSIKGKKVAAVAAPSPKTMNIFIVNGYPDFVPTKDQLPIAVDIDPDGSASPIIYVYDRDVKSWYTIGTGVSNLTEVALNIPGAEAIVKFPVFYEVLGGQVVEGFVTIDELKRKLEAGMKAEIIEEMANG